MRLWRGLYIDAAKVGSLACFVNHSCKPNCKLIPWVVGLGLELGFFVGDEAIGPNTDITISYRFNSSGDRCPCYCREEGCEGFVDGGIPGEDTR